MPKVIVLANQKGGVAKTTLSVNIAFALAELGKRTLLIDTDPQGAASDIAGYRQHRDETLTLADWYKNPEPTIAAKHIFNTSHKNLDLFPATMEAMRASVILAQEPDASYRLQSFVRTNFVRENYDYVIIDTPPNLDLNFNNAVIASDFVIIPITPEMKTARGLSNLQEALDKNMKACKSRVLGMVMTKVKPTVNTHKRVIQFYEDHFADQLMKIQIPDTKDFPEADEKGLLGVIGMKGANKMGNVIFDLTEEVMSKADAISNGR